MLSSFQLRAIGETMRFVRLVQIGAVALLLPLVGTVGLWGSTAGAAGAGYQGTPPVLRGPGGVSFPVVRVVPLSSRGQNAYASICRDRVQFAIPTDNFAAGEQLVLANAVRSASVPGLLATCKFMVAAYRHGTALGGTFYKRLNVILTSSQIRAGDRIYQFVRGRWQLARPYRVINGKLVEGLGSSGLLEIVRP